MKIYKNCQNEFAHKLVQKNPLNSQVKSKRF